MGRPISSPRGELIPADDRTRFRALAANVDLVEEMLDAGIVSRPVILERIAPRGRGKSFPARGQFPRDDRMRFADRRTVTAE